MDGCLYFINYDYHSDQLMLKAGIYYYKQICFAKGSLKDYATVEKLFPVKEMLRLCGDVKTVFSS